MERFQYKKATGMTTLSASFTDFRYKKHSHQEYAIGVTLRGAQQYNLDGKMQTSYPNGVMLFNPEQTHDGMAGDQTGIEYVMLYIDPDVFRDVLDRKESFLFADPVIYHKDLQQKVLNLSGAVLREEDSALCDDLLADLALAFRAKIVTCRKREDHLMKTAKEMIHSLSGDVLALDSICTELELSKFQFIRMFQANEGITPYQYYLNCKVEKAKRIIEESGDIYSAVAGCSFVDLTHLNKHFTRRYGITPFAYLACVRS